MDELGLQGAAPREAGAENRRSAERWLNLRSETSRQPFRRRKGARLRLEQMSGPQWVASARSSVPDHLCSDRGISCRIYKLNRTGPLPAAPRPLELGGPAMSGTRPQRPDCTLVQAQAGCLRASDPSDPPPASLDAALGAAARGHEALTTDVIALSRGYGRHGRRKTKALRHAAAWTGTQGGPALTPLAESPLCVAATLPRAAHTLLKRINNPDGRDARWRLESRRASL
jgi:hypothetical protein